MDGQDEVDIEELHIDPVLMQQILEQQVGKSERKKWRRQFVRVPWSWVERLQKVRRVSSYKLALALLYAHWRSGGRPVALSNVFARAEGLSPRSKWRAIAELESLGLIQVKRYQRRAPRVVLKHLKPEPS